MKRLGETTIGEPRIDGDEVFETEADTAKADGKARQRTVAEFRIGARPAHAIDEPRRPDSREKLHRRQVARKLQGPPRGDHALEGPVEILRPIAGEGGRRIIDEAFGMSEAPLEGKAVDQRLQGRARRALGAGQIVEALALAVEEIGRTDIGKDLAGRRIGDEDRKADRLGKARHFFAGIGLETRLHCLVDGETDASPLAVGLMKPDGRMGGQKRQGAPPCGHGFAHAPRRFVRIDEAERRHSL